jgi:hypothetical protein
MATNSELDGLLEKTQLLDDDDDITKEYLNEAQQCLKYGLARSTILLFWSIFMYKLYKKINSFGLQDFLDIANSKNIKYAGKISSLNDLNKIKDGDIIQLCHEIGFYDQNVKGLLQVRANTRNSIAHISQIKLNPYTVFEFVSDICEYTKLISKLEMKPDPTIMETIRLMDEPSLTKMIQTMAFSKLKSYTDKVFDRLVEIKVHDEFSENLNLYFFVKEGIVLRETEQERIDLFDILFRRGFLTNEISWGSWQFIEKIFDLTKFSYIRKYIIEKNYLEQLVTSLCDSRNYDLAGTSAKGIANFIDNLTESQVNRIARAWLRNSQISESFSASSPIKRIFIAHKSKIEPNILSQLQSNGIEI